MGLQNVSPGTVAVVIEQLGTELLQQAKGRALTYKKLDEVSSTKNLSSALVHAAVGIEPGLRHRRTSDILFSICVGKCVGVGSLHNLQTLLDLRTDRVLNGAYPFDVEARGCLDRCDFRPSMLCRGPFGVTTHTRLRAHELPEIVAALCDEKWD